MSLKMAVGLGNSPREYTATRHNAGRIVLDGLNSVFSENKYCGGQLAKFRTPTGDIMLLKLDGYMNESGVNLAKALKYLKLEAKDIAVFYDEINLDPGQYKLSKGNSDGGHNGVADIIKMCGNEFMRVRIGVGGKADKRMDLADHVLGTPSPSDMEAIKGIDAANILNLIAKDGFEKAQNILNTKKNLTGK